MKESWILAFIYCFYIPISVWKPNYMRDVPVFIELCGTDDIFMHWGKGLRKSEAAFERKTDI